MLFRNTPSTGNGNILAPGQSINIGHIRYVSTAGLLSSDAVIGPVAIQNSLYIALGVRLTVIDLTSFRRSIGLMFQREHLSLFNVLQGSNNGVKIQSIQDSTSVWSADTFV